MRLLVIMRLFIVLVIAFLVISCVSKIPSGKEPFDYASSDKTLPDKIKPLQKIDIKPVEKPKPFEPLFQNEPEETKRHSVIGEWMTYSKGVYYDNGDFRYPQTPNEILLIDEDNTWTFGKYNGKWELSPITDADWKLWGINQYFPKNKITLYGWNDDIASGPVEGGATAQFIWVIYRVGPPIEEAAAQVQMKFGWT